MIFLILLADGHLAKLAIAFGGQARYTIVIYWYNMKVWFKL